MKILTIKNFEDLIKHFDKFNDFNSYVFRGQSNANWSLLPKAGRPEFKNSGFTDVSSFKSWKRYAINFIKQMPSNDWEWYSIAQHHGLATRLLDWSKNPLIATFFAVNSNYGQDAAIFINKAKKYVDEKDFASPFDVKDLSFYYPHGLTNRIILQRGLFSISDRPELAVESMLKDDLIKIIIPFKFKQGFKRQLDFYNINEFSIFQDLDSLSIYLNKYVTTTINLIDIHPPCG
jgi:hypothetical protein